jgi:hypothetical protein
MLTVKLHTNMRAVIESLMTKLMIIVIYYKYKKQLNKIEV